MTDQKQNIKLQLVDFPDPDLALAFTDEAELEVLGDMPLFIKADGTTAKLKEAPKQPTKSED